MNLMDVPAGVSESLHSYTIHCVPHTLWQIVYFSICLKGKSMHCSVKMTTSTWLLQFQCLLNKQVICGNSKTKLLSIISLIIPSSFKDNVCQPTCTSSHASTCLLLSSSELDNSRQTSVCASSLKLDGIVREVMMIIVLKIPCYPTCSMNPETAVTMHF